MMKPRQQRVIEAFRDRLLAIRIVNGYFTNAGEAVFLGIPALGPDDPKLGVAVVPGASFRAATLPRLVALPLVAVAFARDDADLADPLIVAQRVRADVKRAVELVDKTFGGLAQSIETDTEDMLSRDAGSNLVGVAIQYLVRYVEAWGDAVGS